MSPCKRSAAIFSFVLLWIGLPPICAQSCGLTASCTEPCLMTACNPYVSSVSTCGSSFSQMVQARQFASCLCRDPSQFNSVLKECYDCASLTNQTFAAEYADLLNPCPTEAFGTTPAPTNIRTFTGTQSMIPPSVFTLSTNPTSTPAHSYGTRLPSPVWGYYLIFLVAMCNSFYY